MNLLKMFSSASVVALAGGVAVSLFAPIRGMADIVYTDDVIIQDSLCVGIDCVNNENFGFDTLRLKENNLRIHFDDTSNSSGFPSYDWTLIANDSSTGGANYFAIQDRTTNTIPFRVEGGAPTNALVVEADGDIGIRTINPVVDIHVVEGNTPTLRLDQDGSDGFASQVWDVAGNEANFFVRDVTHSSKLPFRIKANAPYDGIFMAANGRIGFGTDGPSTGLHMTNDDAGLILQNTNATAGVREMIQLSNKGGSYITMENTSTSQSWYMTSENASPNRMIFSRSDSAGAYMSLSKDAEMLVTSATSAAAPTTGRGLMTLRSKGGSFVTMENTATGQSWFMTHENNNPNRFLISHSSGGIQLALSSGGDLTVSGRVFTAGSCAAGCDRVFDADYPLPTIAEQSELMFANRHLPNVGPTSEDGPFDLTSMTGGMLNELEKAHIYISQLEERLTALEARVGAE